MQLKKDLGVVTLLLVRLLKINVEIKRNYIIINYMNNTNMENTNMNKVILHGECMVFPSTLPATATPKDVRGDYLIVADSETTGNHHVVDSFQGVNFFEDSGGTIFMQNTKPTKIRCVMADRHDAIDLEPGTWEFGVQQEYDYFTESLRAVRD